MKWFEHLPDIPYTWAITSLGDISTLVQYGLTATADNDSRGVLFLRISDIDDNGRAHLKEPKYISESIADLDKYRLIPGDVVIARSGSVGRSLVYKGSERPWVFASYLIRFRLNQELVDPDYLGFYLRSPYYWQQIENFHHTVAQPNINSRELSAITVPLPPLPEQHHIADIMRQADILRQWREEANKKIEKLQSSIFNKKFGNPNQWGSPIPLGSLVEFVGGGTPSRVIKRYFTGDIPWATSKDIKSRYLDDTQEHITVEAIQNSATNLVPAQTILVVVKSKILMHSLPIGITTRLFCFGQDIKGLICKPGVIPQFIVAAMLAQKDHILKQARGVNTEGLTLDILRAIPIPKTDTDRQKEFLDCVLIYDELENNSNLSHSKLDNLFTSISHRAFTGELTAAWREKHKEELLRAAVERDQKLGLRGEVATLKDAVECRLTPEEEEQFRKTTARIAEKIATFQPNMPNITEKLVAIPDFSGLEVLANRMVDQAAVVQNMQKALGVFALSVQTSLAQMAPIFNTTGSLSQAFIRSAETFREAFAGSLAKIAAENVERAKREQELADVELTEKQKGIFDLLQEEMGYFSARSIGQKYSLKQKDVIDVLALLEAIGLVVKVDIEDEANSTPTFSVFESAYRNSRSSDDSRGDDLDALEQNIIESAT